MKATFKEAERTPLPFEEAARCMNAALAQVLKATPSTEVLALALAKTGLETGRWSAIWCGNWGNVKAGPDFGGMFTCIELNEVIGHAVVWFGPEGELNRRGGEVIGKRWDVPPGHPQTRMRAYANEWDGCFEYVDFVAGGRYRDAWAELLEGDAVGYVHALKLKGYFTADEASYARGVVGLQREFIGRLSGLSVSEFAVPEPEEIRGLIAPQRFNADAVLAWERLQDDAWRALKEERDAQLHGGAEQEDPDE